MLLFRLRRKCRDLLHGCNTVTPGSCYDHRVQECDLYKVLRTSIMKDKNPAISAGFSVFNFSICVTGLACSLYRER
jgi:hypothetical protein